MWYILILLTCVCGAHAVMESLNTNIKYCAALDEYYGHRTRNIIPLHGQPRHVFVRGKAFEVEVWGDRGSARAAAALLYVIIRYGLRYYTKLVTTDVDFCNITSIDWTKQVIVAPAAYWPLTGCLGSRNIDPVAVLSRAAVKSELKLFMYIAPAYRTSCEHFQNWTSFANLNSSKECNFATNHSTGCDDCIVILASKEYNDDIRVIKNQIKDLKLKIALYQSDLQLRQGMKSLREKNMSYLYIYDDLWSDVDGNYELAPSAYGRKRALNEGNTRISFLVGDGTLTEYYAPDIHKVLANNSFAPDTNTLRQIFELEDKFGLEEAACIWANKSIARFENLTKLNDFNLETYKIILLACDNELLDNTTLKHIRQYINNNTSNMQFKILNCSGFKNCNNITQIDHCLSAIAIKKGIIGVVLSNWTDKIMPVVDAAASISVFLAFASPVPNTVNLKTCRSGAGNLFELAQAYHKFFAMSNWNRVAVISEATETAHSFCEALKSSNNVIWNDVVTNKEKIHDVLTELRNLDARIFVLNSEWRLSNEIICVAIELEMTSNEYVWITRDRDVLECRSMDDRQLLDNFKHISIGLEWRGGIASTNFTLSSRQEWNEIQSFKNMNNKSQKASDNKWDDFIVPSNVFNVFKTIIRLSQAFVNFRNNHFEYIYNLHDEFHTAKIASYFDNTTGSTIFIDEWWGNKRRSVAIWRAEEKNVSDICLINNNIFEAHHNIRDRTKCMIKSGDPFAPRCHDVTVVSSLIIILLLIISLGIARRLRLAQMAQNDLILLNAVIDHRRQIASSLDAYLVERHLVRVLHKIGSGCFGRVHFAELTRPGSNAVVVAAKEPHDCIALEEEREFLHEASILALLSHDHIVRLIGICIEDGPPMVLMEHALYLDLRRYLIERRHLALKVSYPTLKRKTLIDDISDDSLTRFVRQAAAALEYLASRRLVHRDVRAANCLIDKERSLKLADFGMARRLNGSDCEYASHRRALFPVLYMAPESLDQGIFSPASDVWALGVLMLEVVTLGARPFGSWPATRVVRHVSLGGHAPLPPDASIHTRNLATSCWRRDPEDRPSAAKIENYLSINPQALSAALLSPNPLTEN